ncbi:MAG: hypothetical protein ACRDWY_09290, partial [Actinomycetes bacterium]
PLPQHAMDQLASRSGGNPMFLAALVQDAVRAGTVSDLPESVEALVTSQVDRLDPVDRTVLRYAAGLGVVLERQALEDLIAEHRPDVDLDSRLPLLRDFLVREGPARLRFRHTLMRDVAYEGLPYRLRRVLHEQVGRAIERSADDPQQVSEVLSLHFFHAGRYHRAWAYSRTAGERARAKYANGEAIDFFERAVESARRSGDIPSGDVADVLEALGDARDLTGRSTDAVQAFRQARARRRDDPVAGAGLLYKEARTHQRLGKVPQSLRILRRALHMIEELDTPAARATRSMLATRYAAGRRTQGRYSEALRWGTVAARDAEDSGDKAVMAHAYNGLLFVHLGAGTTPDLPYGRLALLAYEELGDLAGQGHSVNNLAVEALHAGRWSEVPTLYDRARRTFHRLGDEANEANAVYNQADLLLRRGRLGGAEPVLGEALRMARVVNDEELVALVLRESARVAAAAGRFEEADRLFEDASSRFTGLGLAQELVVVDSARAERLVLRGDAHGAVAAADAAWKHARETHADVLLPLVRRVRGFALMAAGRTKAAAAELRDVVDMAGLPDSRHEVGFALHGLSEIVTDPDEAARLRRESVEILEPLGISVTADWPARRALPRVGAPS